MGRWQVKWGGANENKISTLHDERLRADRIGMARAEGVVIMAARYEVATREHGRPIVKRGPCEGLPDWPRSRWTRITNRPVGLNRATALADSQDRHAVVCVWQTADKVYDNGKAPALPAGWRKDL